MIPACRGFLLFFFVIALVEPTLAGLRIPARYKTWKLKQDSGSETTLDQTYAPFIYSIPLSDKSSLIISSNMATSNVTASSSESAVDGGVTAGSDVVLQTVYRLGQSMLIQAGINVPTGKTGLSLEEFLVLRSVSHPLLGFPLRQAGQGFNVSLGAAWAYSLSKNLEGGLGVGGIRRGRYNLLEDVYERYQPASELTFSAGLTARNLGLSSFEMDLTYRSFGDDTIDGVTAYEQGSQAEATLSLQTVWNDSWESHLSTRGVFKQDSAVPSNDGLETLYLAPGNSYTTTLEIRSRVSNRVSWGVSADARVFRGSETARQDGTAFGVGPTLLVQSGHHGTWQATPQFLSGTLRKNGSRERVELSGWAVTLTYLLREK